jgi:O-antigen ligase
MLGVLLVALLLFSAFQEVRRPGRSDVVATLYPAMAMMALVAAWAVFQSLPWNLMGWHHPIWDRASEVLGFTLDASIGLDREAAFVRLFRLTIYAGFFTVAWQAARRSEGAGALVGAVALIGTAYSLYGLIEFASPHPHILWFPKDAYAEDVTGTFVNRNSFATFAGLSLIADLALLANVLIKHSDFQSRTSFALSLVDNLFARARWYILGLIVLAGSVLLSHSRAGLIAVSIGIAALLILIAAAPSIRSRWGLWFGGSVAAGWVGIVLLTGSTTFDRFGLSATDHDIRPGIDTAVLRAIGDNLIAGTGLGSFSSIFQLYQPLSVPGYVDTAHNDYLENILELGLPAALLLFGTVLYLGARCIVGVFKRRRDAVYPCAGAAATVLVGVHSAFDFSLQIPAVTIVYATLLGVGVAQSVNSRNSS